MLNKVPNGEVSDTTDGGQRDEAGTIRVLKGSFY